eukprot:TRINITY_DN5590_c0_g1_i2.p1 TRINITY_DN5590_c0_g1~~TRINITY_DN5590_c0_g1_i2.p1  ORF type:complete len:275 (+),score=43.97 TRINITY_DN5590_c0_g1_i2:131-955(+)
MCIRDSINAEYGDHSRPMRLLGTLLLFAVASAVEESGYELWLRYTPQTIPSPFSELICPVPSTACAELTEGLNAMFGNVTVGRTPSQDGALVLTFSETAVVDLRSNDAYNLTLSQVNGHSCTVLAAHTSRGAVYGAFALLRELQLGHSLVLPMSEAPASNLRMWDLWDNLDGTVERGYACAEGRSNCSALWPVTPESNRTALRRARDYARVLASVGLNSIVLTNVNACSRENKMSLSSSVLTSQIVPIAAVFASYGIPVSYTHLTLPTKRIVEN